MEILPITLFVRNSFLYRKFITLVKNSKSASNTFRIENENEKLIGKMSGKSTNFEIEIL